VRTFKPKEKKEARHLPITYLAVGPVPKDEVIENLPIFNTVNVQMP
jgi:hypothetical protein